MPVDITTEWDRIQPVAFAHGVDAFLIAAIRSQENGPPTTEAGHPFGEFGLPAPGYPSYDTQLAGCCKTIRRYVVEFQDLDAPAMPLFELREAHTGNRRVCYTPGFIGYCGRRYAPVGVANDPGRLNQAWSTGVAAFYQRFVAEGVDAPR